MNCLAIAIHCTGLEGERESPRLKIGEKYHRINAKSYLPAGIRSCILGLAFPQ